MADAIIENPVINSPFEEPLRHFKFTEEGITNEIVEGRRSSSYFVPIARPKRKDKQLIFDTEWTKDRIEENKDVNRIRESVSNWRKGKYPGITTVTRQLLEYWTNPQRERKLFFCQIEALETAIYITEAAKRSGDSWIDNKLAEANALHNRGLPRIAMKMATGSGKTVVMGMLIAWQALNKLANSQDARFSDTFLIITPGITIRDRLRVLLPNDPDNYYRQRDILPTELINTLGQAKILITNYHAFLQREKVKAGRLTKALLSDGDDSAFTETPDEMVRRVCRELGSKKNIIVINDEAHHCYRRKEDGKKEKLSREEQQEAKKRDEEARVWISGIEAVKNKIGVKRIYDLSATPFFLRGSGEPEGTLFRWVVSDFSLIDAIESGIVKVPRVPVDDDAVAGIQPTYRDLWQHIREGLPKKGRKTDAISGEPNLPEALEGALLTLYGNYKKHYERWENNHEARNAGLTPPVFIVVCNNTNVSKMVYDYIAGWEKQVNERPFVQAGNLDLFRNDDGRGNWLNRPNTILVDSEQLESGEAMTAEFKQIAAREIEEFKHEYRQRFPGRDTDQLTDEDLLREVMNTVGKAGKLGEHVKCVVSVSMLTEGWDANTVTHVLGVRAFGTQLLCEQVVGRALRRMSYVLNDDNKFDPEYAEVFGVPFSFIPCSGSTREPKPGPLPTRVRAMEERQSCEMTFPRLSGYRFDVKAKRLKAAFNEASTLALSTQDVPTTVINAPIIGEEITVTLDELKERRSNEVVFRLAKWTLETYFRDDEGNQQVWLFPQLLNISREWLQGCLTLKDNTFVQLLLISRFANDAAGKIYDAIVRGSGNDNGEAILKPILRPYDSTGSTRYVDFDTTRPTYTTDPKKCHISHIVEDSRWETKMAQSLEAMPEVLRYAKNYNLGFSIPYIMNNERQNYYPDFLVHYNDRNDENDPLNLIIEVTGEQKKDKQIKVETAMTRWVPAVNNHGGFGRWAFIEITDPWNAQTQIRQYMRDKSQPL